jgi:hypothetical protein
MSQSLQERAAGWGERGAETVEGDLEYLPGEPVRVVVRKRSIRYDISDDGRAIALAGKPRGWRPVAERLCAEEGMNLARDGRVWVLVTQGRDLDALAARIAELSAEVYDAVLDLEG